ncbi:MAG: hypothetical protein JWN40_5008 [Phycisphaerales bacterium]|nr:hypothetical protein [Phycisphaerales bacterium]
MGRITSRVVKGKLLGITVAAVGLLVITVGPLTRVWGDAASQQPSAPLIALGFKFEGAAGCNNAKCHGGTAPNAAPKPAGNEYVTWSEKDKHAEAYKTLTKPESAKITQAMGLKEKPQDSPLCTNCHALVVPANLQMAKYNVREGVTCGACHGPYEKWAEPHNKEGGANDLRKKAGYTTLEAESLPYSTMSPEHQKLLKDVGLYDTRPILARAEKCTSCHLAIDAKLIEAGHPQPIFELAYYTGLENPHWREPGGYWDTKVWAAGQIICLRDAMTQLADRASAGASDKLIKDAYNQAMGHLEICRSIAGSALDGPAKDLKAAAGDKAKLATIAKSISGIAGKLTAPVAAMKPSAGNTAGAISKIVADSNVATDAGLRGAQQQALSLASLAGALKKGGNPAGIDPVQKAIDDKLLALVGDEATFKPDVFNAALKDVAAKVQPLLKGAEAVDLK